MMPSIFFLDSHRKGKYRY